MIAEDPGLTGEQTEPSKTTHKIASFAIALRNESGLHQQAALADRSKLYKSVLTE